MSKSHKTEFYGTNHVGYISPEKVERRVAKAESVRNQNRLLKLGAGVLVAAAVFVGSKTSMFERADSPNGRAVPTHPVTVENANGIKGASYTSEQGNAPAESSDNP